MLVAWYCVALSGSRGQAMDFNEREANGPPQCVLAFEAKSPVSASVTEAYGTVSSAPRMQCHMIIGYIPGAPFL